VQDHECPHGISTPREPDANSHTTQIFVLNYHSQTVVTDIVSCWQSFLTAASASDRSNNCRQTCHLSVIAGTPYHRLWVVKHAALDLSLSGRSCISAPSAMSSCDQWMTSPGHQQQQHSCHVTSLVIVGLTSCRVWNDKRHVMWCEKAVFYSSVNVISFVVMSSSSSSLSSVAAGRREVLFLRAVCRSLGLYYLSLLSTFTRQWVHVNRLISFWGEAFYCGYSLCNLWSVKTVHSFWDTATCVYRDVSIVSKLPEFYCTPHLIYVVTYCKLLAFS